MTNNNNNNNHNNQRFVEAAPQEGIYKMNDDYAMNEGIGVLNDTMFKAFVTRVEIC